MVNLEPAGVEPVRSTRRRWIAGGAAGLGLAGLGAYIYSRAPGFWRQFIREARRPIAAPPQVPQPHRWPDTGLHAAWLGHTTVLLKVEGHWILTDPVFSSRAGIYLGVGTLGVKRLVEPALPPEQLPPMDLLLLSHAHMDHMDLPSLRRLENRRTAVVLARHTSDLIRTERYRQVREVGWGERVQVGPAGIEAFEVNHWGARLRSDTYRGYSGFVLQIGRWRILFGGDTGDTPVFRRLKVSKPYHLAIMPIGAYNPWRRRHCTPEEAWRMANEAGADLFLPVHHQTFILSREPIMEPIERLFEAAGNQASRIVIRAIGQECHLS